MRCPLDISGRDASGDTVWRDALLFLLAAIILRAPSLTRSVIDWDESLYFLMAEQWRAGHLPYTTLWDNKPIGIYALFAIAQTLFGDRVAAIRLAAMLAVASTALLLSRLMRLIAPEVSPWPGRLAGGLYILGSTLDGGMASNSELFMAPFTCLGFWHAWHGRAGPQPWHRALATGAIMGLACMVKYVAIFDAGVVLAVILLGAQTLTAATARTLAFAAGGFLMLALGFLPYLLTGQSHVFITDSLAANLRRTDMPIDLATARYVLTWQIKDLAPLYGAALILAIDTGRRLRHGIAGLEPPLLLMGWLLASLLGAASAKSFYFHYFLQMLPPLALISAWMWWHCAVRPAVMALGLLAWPAIAASVVLHDTLRPVDWHMPGLLKDEPARIAADLRPALAAAPVEATPLYIFDDEPILYSLTRTQPPTKYAFPSFMISPFLAGVASVDPEAAFARIMAGHPRFIIRSDLRHPQAGDDDLALYAACDQALARDYTVWRRYGEATIYRRRSP